jgi:hypothetical protein
MFWEGGHGTITMYLQEDEELVEDSLTMKPLSMTIVQDSSRAAHFRFCRQRTAMGCR